MPRIKYHVTPTPNRDWRVKREGSKKAANVFENKSDAIERAKELAKKHSLSQVIVHSKKKIQTEYTYGKDPKRYPS
jgi:uncharacterized protein YdaT